MYFLHWTWRYSLLHLIAITVLLSGFWTKSLYFVFGGNAFEHFLYTSLSRSSWIICHLEITKKMDNKILGILNPCSRTIKLFTSWIMYMLCQGKGQGYGLTGINCLCVYRENCRRDSSCRHVAIYIQRLTCRGKAPSWIWPIEWRMVLECWCTYHCSLKRRREAVEAWERSSCDICKSYKQVQWGCLQLQ